MQVSFALEPELRSGRAAGAAPQPAVGATVVLAARAIVRIYIDSAL